MLYNLYVVLRYRFSSVFSGGSNSENGFVLGGRVTDFSYLNKALGSARRPVNHYTVVGLREGCFLWVFAGVTHGCRRRRSSAKVGTVAGIQ